MTPRVKRKVPLSTSVPIMPNSIPVMIIAIAFSTEPWASAVAVTRPRRMSAKYSVDPNFSAMEVSGTATRAIRNVAKVPATNEPMAAIASAFPAMPWRAI